MRATSNSSPEPTASQYAWFCRSLGILRRDDPVLYRECVIELAELSLELRVQTERFWLRARPGELVCDLDGSRPSAACVASDRATLIDLVRGDLTLLDAIRSDRLFVQAAPSVLTRLGTLARVYLHATVRLPAQRELWKAWVAAQEDSGIEPAASLQE